MTDSEQTAYNIGLSRGLRMGLARAEDEQTDYNAGYAHGIEIGLRRAAVLLRVRLLETRSVLKKLALHEAASEVDLEAQEAKEARHLKSPGVVE